MAVNESSRGEREVVAISKRIAALDWARIAAELDERGYATSGPLLTAAQCRTLVKAYDADELFRRQVIMCRHGYGSGEYKYFAYPLPPLIVAMRTAFYPPLAEVANRWNEAMKIAVRFPDDHESFLKSCHEAGQLKPTPLLLKYGPGDYNCLHQDVYGEHVFPLQVAILLSEPGADFTGGEFVLTEQRPRMQSRVEVVPLERGEAVVFPVRHRPGRGARGVYRLNMRHGVSRLHTGQRFTAGIIFHDAS